MSTQNKQQQQTWLLDPPCLQIHVCHTSDAIAFSISYTPYTTPVSPYSSSASSASSAYVSPVSFVSLVSRPNSNCFAITVCSTCIPVISGAYGAYDPTTNPASSFVTHH